jgi:glycosyltransferase involved in cell wall biosynthesis
LIVSPSPIRVSVLTNIPAPYRVPVFNKLAATPGIDLTVLYAAMIEPDRSWDLPAMDHPHHFLRERLYRNRKGKFIHNNPDAYPLLRRLNPHVVLTNGFNPTHLYGFAYSQIFRRKHIAMTDGTIETESELSVVHGALRRIVFSRSAAFVAASRASRALLMKHGAPESKIFLSPLCANTSVAWRSAGTLPRSFDLLFSGRLVDVKNPLFALDVAARVAEQLGRRVSLAMLGSGPLEGVLKERSSQLQNRVEVALPGHIAQAELPRWFGSARLFLFPTSWDPWGVVANEACMAGLPTIISPHAGAAGELIVDGTNGYVRELDASQWAAACVELFTDHARYAAFSREATRQVEPYSFENAARGMAAATRLAVCENGSIKPKPSTSKAS